MCGANDNKVPLLAVTTKTGGRGFPTPDGYIAAPAKAMNSFSPARWIWRIERLSRLAGCRYFPQ